jgi:hypothetical protein
MPQARGLTKTIDRHMIDGGLVGGGEIWRNFKVDVCIKSRDLGT